MTDTTTEDPRLASLKPFFDRLRSNIAAYKALEARVAAADGDREAALAAWMESTTDDDAVQIRDVISRAQAKLRLLAESKVQSQELSPEERRKLGVEFEEMAKKVKGGSRGLRGLVEPFDIDLTPYLREMGDPFLPKAPTGTGSALPRPSVYVEVTKVGADGSDEQTWNFDSLGSAAKLLEPTGLGLEDLGKLYAEKAGVAYEEISKVKESHTFTWRNDSIANASTYRITTTPKESARGRKAVENKAA